MHFTIINHWIKDEAFIIPEFVGEIKQYDSLQIKWSKRSFTFEKGDLESSWKLAVYEYMSIIENDSLTYFNQYQNEWKLFLAHPNEQTQCKIVLKDYLTLVSKY